MKSISTIIPKPLKHVLQRLQLNLRHFKWNKYLKRLSKTSINQSIVSAVARLETYERLLLVAPHADDELLSSYTLLSQGGVDIYYCGFTGKNLSKKNSEIRLQEFQSFCKAMNCSYFIGTPQLDGLLQQLIQNRYEAILLPSIVDWHHEHRLVNYRMSDVLQECGLKPQIIWYSVSVPIVGTQRPIYYSLLTKEEQLKKYELFYEFYKSQYTMDIYRFSIRERINAIGISQYAAELFMRLTFDEWVHIIYKVRDSEYLGDYLLLLNLRKLYNCLNSLEEVEALATKLYQHLQV